MHEPERVIEPGNWAISEVGCKTAVHHDVNLHGAGRYDCRAHQTQNITHPIITPLHVEAEPIADPMQRRPLHRQLEKPADDNAHSHSNERVWAKVRIHQPGAKNPANNRAKIEEARCHGRHPENVLGVEQSHHQRSQRYQENEWPHDAGQQYGELGFFLGKTATQKTADQLWREDDAKHRQCAHKNKSQRADLIG